MSDGGNGGETERAHVWVTGLVQGVAFRYAASRQAEDSGVSGWVRNLPDGRVEAVLEGTPDQVQEMISWCESGPSSADVEDVSVEREPPENLRDFEVR